MTIYFDIPKTRVQLGWSNASYDRKTTGVQVAISGNGADNYRGMQIAPVGVNIAGGEKGGMKGVQVGLWNNALRLKGVQIGLFDIAIEGPCLQIGLFTMRGGNRPWYRQISPFIGWAGEGDYKFDHEKETPEY